MNAAYDDSREDLSDQARRSRGLRFELIFASLGLAFGLFLLPALIYWVGAALLGPYGEKAGLSTFYIDFYGDLAEGTARAWMIALGPVVLLYLIRALFIGVPTKGIALPDDDVIPPAAKRSPARKESKPEPRKEAAKDSRRTTRSSSRVEPRVGAD